MRRGKLMALEWEDIDVGAGVVTVRNKAFHPTKFRKSRVLALVPAAVELLESLGNGRRAGLVFQTKHGRPMKNNLNRLFSQIVKKVGIHSCTLHDLRMCMEIKDSIVVTSGRDVSYGCHSEPRYCGTSMRTIFIRSQATQLISRRDARR